MNSTSISIAERPDATAVCLSGDITEHTDFSPLLERTPPVIAFDLSGVRRINSCGVREWMNFVGRLRERGTTFSLERCSVSVVGQLNMIANFGGGARVRSVYVPYFCEGCGAEQSRLLELAGGREATLQAAAQAPACGKCGQPTQLDDLPEAYFSFIEPR